MGDDNIKLSAYILNWMKEKEMAQAEKVSRLFKALSVETRVRMLELLKVSSDLPVILFSEHILSNFGWGFRQLLANYHQLGIEGMHLLDWRINNQYADFIKRSLPLKMI